MGDLREGSLPPSATSLHPAPSPATSCLSSLGSWVPWAGFCGQEPFSLSSVGEAFPPPLHSPLLGRGWLGKEGGGSWCAGVNVCYKGSCFLAFSSPLGAPSHLCLPWSSPHYPRLCVCSQPAGGGARWQEGGGMVTAGLIWAPGEKRLLTQEKLGRNSRAGDGEGKSRLGVGMILGWQLNLGLRGSGGFEQCRAKGA